MSRSLGFFWKEVREPLAETFSSVQLINYLNGTSNTVFRPNRRSQPRGALPHFLICHGLLNGLCQPLGRKIFSGNGLRPNTQVRNSLTPKGLIAEEGDNDRGNACPESRGSGSGTTVMNYGGDPREKPRMWNGVDHEYRIRQIRLLQASPAGGDHCSLMALLQSLKNQIGRFLWFSIAHASKANVYSWRTGI